MDSDAMIEPLPFLLTDVPMPGTNPSTLEDQRVSRGRTVSTVSSGVLGMDMIETDPESDGENTIASASSFDQLVRSVSLVRRGQARIIRNPSARRVVPPDVYPCCFILT